MHCARSCRKYNYKHLGRLQSNLQSRYDVPVEFLSCIRYISIGYNTDNMFVVEVCVFMSFVESKPDTVTLPTPGRTLCFLSCWATLNLLTLIKAFRLWGDNNDLLLADPHSVMMITAKEVMIFVCWLVGYLHLRESVFGLICLFVTVTPYHKQGRSSWLFFFFFFFFQ